MVIVDIFLFVKCFESFVPEEIAILLPVDLAISSRYNVTITEGNPVSQNLQTAKDVI